MFVVATLKRLGGLAPARDLQAAGMRPGLIYTAWRAGEITRFRKGWYALPSLHPDVIRASRVGGSVACMSAARLNGLWTPDDRDLHVAVPPSASRLRAPADHKSPLSDSSVRIHWSGDVRAPYEHIEPLERAIPHIMDCRGRRAAFVVLESALHRGLRGADALAADVASRDALFRSASRDSASGLESWLKLELLAAGISFRQQVTVSGCGIADFLIGRRLVVETDGREFHDPLVDRQRDARFSAAGYRTLRFLSHQVFHETDAMMASIRAAIARRDHV